MLFILFVYTVYELNNFLIIKFIIEGYLFYRIHIILDPTLREEKNTKTEKYSNIANGLLEQTLKTILSQERYLLTR